MMPGTVYIIHGFNKSCKYLCVTSDPLGYRLKRLVPPKSKADNNRFPETISIEIGARTVPEKGKIK